MTRSAGDPPDLLDLTAELVDIRSESHQEHALTAHVERRLRDEAPWLELESVGLNVVARTRLGRPGRVLLAGHTDTVPVADNWPSRRDGDRLWGCGTSDMKSGLAVMLALALSLPEPELDVSFVFYEAEEVDARFNGLKRLFDERPDLLAGDVALLGEPTGAVIEAGCQGTMRLRVVLRGTRAHTARPWMGRNAVHRLGPVLTAIAAWTERRPVLDGCEYREALQAVRVEGGVSGNVVPDEVSLLVNHRFAPDRSAQQAEATVRDLLSPFLDADDTCEVVDVADAAAPSLHHPVLESMVARHGLAVRAKLGWTDVARFAAHGIPAANFGPGDATVAHTRGEAVDRGPIERVYAVLHDVLTTGV